jgi:hypothetical protein
MPNVVMASHAKSGLFRDFTILAAQRTLPPVIHRPTSSLLGSAIFIEPRS